MNKIAQRFQNDVVARYHQKMAALVKRAEDNDLLDQAISPLQLSTGNTSSWDPDKFSGHLETFPTVGQELDMSDDEYANMLNKTEGSNQEDTLSRMIANKIMVPYNEPSISAPVPRGFHGFGVNPPENALNTAAALAGGVSLPLAATGESEIADIRTDASGNSFWDALGSYNNLPYPARDPRFIDRSDLGGRVWAQRYQNRL